MLAPVCPHRVCPAGRKCYTITNPKRNAARERLRRDTCHNWIPPLTPRLYPACANPPHPQNPKYEKQMR